MEALKGWLYTNSYKLMAGFMVLIISGSVLIANTTSDVGSNAESIKANTVSIEKIDDKLDKALESLARIEGRLKAK